MLVNISPETPSDVGVTLSGTDILQLDNQTNVQEHEIKEETFEVAEVAISSVGEGYSLPNKIVKKRGRKRKYPDLQEINPNNPPRYFSLKWLRRPELREWLIPIPNKPSHVFCKWCKALLRAHLHDLKKHATCKKHRRQSLVHSNINSLKHGHKLDDYLGMNHDIKPTYDQSNKQSKFLSIPKLKLYEILEQ